MPIFQSSAEIEKKEKERRRAKREERKERKKRIREQDKLILELTKRAEKSEAECEKEKKGKEEYLAEKEGYLAKKEEYLAEKEGYLACVTAMIPVVAGVIFREYYSKIRVGPSKCSHADHAKWIHNLQERFWDFGCEKPEDVDDFSELPPGPPLCSVHSYQGPWVSTMAERNTAAHTIGGQHVIAILPHCDPKLRGVLERAFKFLWEVSVDEWEKATPDRKDRTFSR
ncbi:hypothetical protein B9Z19DRAFT_1063588 [Tuber borchii]|uniref:Uncharacterized protein n=1 Tax=Tuber borchii TaxID=42251 RepID=A0A2T6ZXU3_TUBBO|nr:hypothetical protein B9Z19DRAFT_1063588 [Tuber borchii]